MSLLFPLAVSETRKTTKLCAGKAKGHWWNAVGLQKITAQYWTMMAAGFISKCTTHLKLIEKIRNRRQNILQLKKCGMKWYDSVYETHNFLHGRTYCYSVAPRGGDTVT